MRPIVDVHHHAPLSSYVSRLRTIGVQAQPGVDFPPWEPADSLSVMDELGVDVAVLSIGSPGFYFGDQSFTTALCRDANDELTDIVAARSNRFAALACLPLPAANAALDEWERVRGRSEFVGVELLSNYGGHYLGNPIFDPLLAELDNRSAVAHVHPVLPAAWPVGEIPLRPSVLEYLFDTTRTITSLLVTGAFDRYPQITWVFSHCGGALPSVAPRMVLAEGMPELADLDDGIMAVLRRLHFDTALSITAGDVGALLTFVDDTQLLLGTDFPFSDAAAVRSRTAVLRDFLGPGLFDRVGSANALRIVPGLERAIR